MRLFFRSVKILEPTAPADCNTRELKQKNKHTHAHSLSSWRRRQLLLLFYLDDTVLSLSCLFNVLSAFVIDVMAVVLSLTECVWRSGKCECCVYLHEKFKCVDSSVCLPRNVKCHQRHWLRLFHYDMVVWIVKGRQSHTVISIQPKRNKRMLGVADAIHTRILNLNRIALEYFICEFICYWIIIAALERIIR